MSAPFGDGGPAFPNRHQEDGRGNVMQYSDQGMTLRDYFAAKAMQAAASGGCFRSDADWPHQAELAYGVADAMLKARQS